MNSKNAHQYLPLVQALAEGKTIQALDCGAWVDLDGTDFHQDSNRYRVKPLEWPPKPEGMEWQNGHALTPEQVGDGFRLLVTKEQDNHFYEGDEYWSAADSWSKNQGPGKPGAWRQNHSTIRVPLSTPYPDGSYVKDGKLVKPWVPRFKVGDRVKSKATGNIWKIGMIDAKSQKYGRTIDRCGCWEEDLLEPAPWSISRHLPGFRPLRDGEEWHRQDWTEEMLPDGWRPLLKGETTQRSDVYFKTDALPVDIVISQDCSAWESEGGGPRWFRTRRSLPPVKVCECCGKEFV